MQPRDGTVRLAPGRQPVGTGQYFFEDRRELAGLKDIGR